VPKRDLGGSGWGPSVVSWPRLPARGASCLRGAILRGQPSSRSDRGARHRVCPTRRGVASAEESAVRWVSERCGEGQSVLGELVETTTPRHYNCC
jgi:hypothetical protein